MTSRSQSDQIAFQVDEHHQVLTHFHQNLDQLTFNDITTKLATHSGHLYFLGIGKSDNLARHYADLLKSIGLSAFRLSVSKLLHGDIGVIRPGDIVVLISKSGNTPEMQNIMPAVRDRRVHVIGLFTNPHGHLVKYCDQHQVLPCSAESSTSFNLVPSHSIMVFMIYANLLVSSLIQLRSVSIEDYGRNHPQGSIGKHIWETVDDIMERELPLKRPMDTVQTVMHEMLDRSSGVCFLINEQRHFVGLVSNRDLHHYLIDGGLLSDPIETIMNRQSLIARQGDRVASLVKEIEQRKLKCLSGIPVLNHDDIIIGYVNYRSIIKMVH